MSAAQVGPFTLAVSSEMVFLDLPVVERVRRISDLGFEVEIWDWTRHDIEALVSLRDEGVVFSSMTGYVRGTLTDPVGSDELLATAEQSVPVAQRLGIPRLNLHGTGLDSRGLPVRPEPVVTGPMWLAARHTLSRIAALGERAGLVFVLENLNTAVDHPGVPFATAKDCLALVSDVDSPHLRLMLDLYHAQIGEGNSSSSADRPCRSSARSRWRMSRGGASPAPGRSATRPWPGHWRTWGMPARWASRRGRPGTARRR